MKCGRCGEDKPDGSFLKFAHEGKKYLPKCDECKEKNRARSKAWREAQALKKRHSILESEKADVKTCRGCLKELPISDFGTYWHKQMDCYLHQSKCRKCQNEAAAAWRKKYRARRMEYMREYMRQRNKTSHAKTVKLRRDLKAFGISIEKYEEMCRAAGNLCEICRRPEKGSGRLSVDHSHSTGAVRGVLCRACNVAIGNFEDDAERLRRAATYLEQRK